jgi:S-ribosylhomocysteine lyase
MADLDHRFMTPPSLRIVDQRAGAAGDQVFVWDLRIAQPNVSHVAMPVVHSLEHFLGSYLKDSSPAIVAVAPMGCQTGLYIVAINIGTFEDMAALLERGLASVAEAADVPLANVLQCGWAQNHSLAGVQELAAWLLRNRSGWAEPGPEAAEIRAPI